MAPVLSGTGLDEQKFTPLLQFFQKL
jgi:hypothetical protein